MQVPLSLEFTGLNCINHRRHTVKREMFTDDLFGEFRDRGKNTKINHPKLSLVLVYTQIRELSLIKRELLDILVDL